MAMHDKEFDSLFQAKLNNLEIAPAAHVWQGINAGLDTRKRKRLLPVLSMAAGIILLLTAGLLFVRKPVKINSGRQALNKMAKNTLNVTKSVPKVNPAAIVQKPQNKTITGVVIAPVSSLAQAIKVTADTGRYKTQAPVNGKQGAGKSGDDLPVLALAGHAREAVKLTIPDTAAPVTLKPVNIEDAQFKIQPVLLAAQLLGNDRATVPAAAKKHRIRSFGDVMNVVIAAVDKRKDKIIEFSNTDEDDATITGVNLGIVKIKKEK